MNTENYFYFSSMIKIKLPDTELLKLDFIKYSLKAVIGIFHQYFLNDSLS